MSKKIELLREAMEHYIPFNRFLGIKVTAARVGFARMELPFRDEYVGDPSRPALHGGLISTLADTVGGLAVWTEAEGENTRVSTIDLRIDYLRPGKLLDLCAEATVARVGNRVGVVDIRVFHPNHEHENIATGKGVYNIARPKSK